MNANEIGKLHNEMIRSWLPKLRQDPNPQFVYRSITKLALRRKWIKKESRVDLARWLQGVVRDARRPRFIESLELSRDSKAYLGKLSSLALASDLTKGASKLIAEARAIEKPAVADFEASVLDVALSVLEHSAQLWAEEAEAQAAKEGGGGGNIIGGAVDSDINGAIGGAVGAAAASWWSGVAVGPAAGIGALVGAAASSAITFLEEGGVEGMVDEAVVEGAEGGGAEPGTDPGSNDNGGDRDDNGEGVGDGEGEEPLR
jgi:hypothetical protein